ncbi:cholesterol 24-hydroxylase isoform X1 [Strongylocentrotus purpuratus]|uniref:Cholesterol 24-hydroxylase n=1 Tax=Strongylocentrotus purpuratus TaxID=7668 RepID=A0A7M7SY48_STRPU|nr:cholesterol 24-hydroxylase isoform X1 [Strongylocentrotus purpuratus]
MAMILTVLGYVALLICVILGLAIVVLSAAILRTEYVFKDVPTPKHKSFFLGDIKKFGAWREKIGMPLANILYLMTKDLGPVYYVRVFWKAHFFASAPEIVKELLLNSRHIKPQEIYHGFQKLYGERFMGHGLVSEVDHEKWFHRRAIMNPAFRRKYLISLMEEYNSGSEALCQKLKEKADGKIEVPMLDELNKVTLDVIAKIAFSMDTNAIGDPDCPFPAAITAALQGLQSLHERPWSTMDPRCISMRRSTRKAIHLIRETGRDQIKERIRARKRADHVPSDLLNLILDIANDLEGDKDFGMENMLDEFVTLFIAGQETTSNLLAFTILQLGRHPDVAKKLQAEVDEVLGQKHTIQYEDLAKLEYMMRVLKETLRLYSPVGGTTRLTAHPVKYNGITIPAKATVTVMSYVMSRMEEYFDDPLLFNPDRFKPSEDGSLPRHLYAYFPFSMGQRSCIGQQFALIEARVILAKLLQRFEFRLEQSQSMGILDELTSKPMGRCKNYITLRA